MGFHIRFVFLIFLFFARQGHAEVMGFWVWQPQGPAGVRYLLPKIKDNLPRDIARQYLAAMKSSEVYGRMENAHLVDLSTEPETFRPLGDSSPIHPHVAVILNRPNQMTDESPYLKTVIRSFQKEGPELYAVPVGLETVMDPTDMQDFRKKLNSFDGQLGVGGDDPHPLLFGKKGTKRTKGDISVDRDTQQIAYMREYLAHGKGRVFYICGSMQRAAIADGHGFHSEIAPITQVPHRGEVGTTMIEVVAEPDSELAIAAGQTKFLTTNYHHAAVNGARPQEGKSPKSKITAYNIEPDGSRGRVVKAIEFPGHAGFATQFHPEFRGSPEENRIVHYVATGWKLRSRAAPMDIVRCMRNSLANLLEESSGPGIAP